jgi:hypothetical protein
MGETDLTIVESIPRFQPNHSQAYEISQGRWQIPIALESPPNGRSVALAFSSTIHSHRRPHSIPSAPPVTKAMDSYLPYSRWESSSRVTERYWSRCGFQMGDAAVRPGENWHTEGCDETSGRGHSRIGHCMTHRPSGPIAGDNEIKQE